MARLFLSPLIGLAMLVAMATVAGWFGPGLRCAYCLPLTLLLVGAGFFYWFRGGQRRRVSIRSAATFLLFVGLASAPMIDLLLVRHAFNPYNDTFFYLVEAQWLQRHGFAQIAVPDPLHPAWLVVTYFQRTGLRMAPSFVLGWLQAAGGLPWSYLAYPAVLDLFVVAGGMAAGALVLAACPGRRRAAWLIALVTATGYAGLAAGARLGFLPQTCGMAFVTGWLALRGLELLEPASSHPRTPWQRLRAAFPQALLAAAGIFCYPELLPFAAAAWGLTHLWCPGARPLAHGWRRQWCAAWPVILLTGVMVNFEWPRVCRAIVGQFHAVAGNPVAWAPAEFLAHSLGWRGATFSSARWIWKIRSLEAAIGLAVAIFFALLIPGAADAGVMRRRRFAPLWPAIVLLAVLSAAFLWFRYVAANPWPHGLGVLPAGQGQSWSQFKLSEWASPATIAVAGSLVVWLWRDSRGLSRLALVLWTAAGLVACVHNLGSEADGIRQGVGTDDPYFTLAELAKSVPAADTVYLDLPGDDFQTRKLRSMLAYFFCDHPLAGDWTGDLALLPDMLPAAARVVPRSGARWILRREPPDPGLPGGLVLRPNPSPPAP